MTTEKQIMTLMNVALNVKEFSNVKLDEIDTIEPSIHKTVVFYFGEKSDRGRGSISMRLEYGDDFGYDFIYNIEVMITPYSDQDVIEWELRNVVEYVMKEYGNKVTTDYVESFESGYWIESGFIYHFGHDVSDKEIISVVKSLIAKFKRLENVLAFGL